MATSASVAMPIMTAGLYGKLGGVQQAERGAGVLHVRQIEESGNDVDASS